MPMTMPMTTSAATTPTPDPPGPLDGLRVVDASEHLSGQYATRLMCALGAQVTLVEPPTGSRIRRFPPYSTSGASQLFRHINLGKHSVALDTDTPTGAGLLGRLTSSADVLVVGHRLADIRTRADLATHTVVCHVSDFGRTGPRAEWRGGEMIHQALAGLMYVTGDGEKEPIYGCGYRAYYAAGVAAFNTVLVALQVRDDAGDAVGQDVEVTVAETAAAMAQNGATVYDYNGTWARRGKYRGLIARIQCADGWVVVFGLRHWPELCTAFNCAELADDPRFATPAARTDNWNSAIAMFRERSRNRPAAEIVDTAQAGKACVEHMNNLQDVLGSTHLQARGFFRRQPQDDESFLVLGPAWRMSESSRWSAGPAPATGQLTPALVGEDGPNGDLVTALASDCVTGPEEGRHHDR